MCCACLPFIQANEVWRLLFGVSSRSGSRTHVGLRGSSWPPRVEYLRFHGCLRNFSVRFAAKMTFSTFHYSNALFLFFFSLLFLRDVCFLSLLCLFSGKERENVEFLIVDSWKQCWNWFFMDNLELISSSLLCSPRFFFRNKYYFSKKLSLF